MATQADTDAFVGLQAALEPHGGIATANDGRWLVGSRTFLPRVRRPAAAGTRIVDALKVHVTDVERQRAGKALVGRAREERPAEELLVMLVPRLPDIGDAVGQLAHEPAWHDAAWAVISTHGGYHVAIPGLPRPLSSPDRTRPSAATQLTLGVDPVQRDLPAAILSLLLLRRVNRTRWRRPPACLLIETPQVLASALGVGRSALYAALNDLEDRGWILPRHGRLPDLVDLPGLVNRFLDYAKHRRRRQRAVVPLYAAWTTRDHVMDWLRQQAVPGAGPSWAVTGWQACQQHGLSVLTNLASKPVEIVVAGEMDNLLRRLSLQEVSAPTASTLLLSRAATPLATVLGLDQDAASGYAVVDPWQAALAVASDPQRGIEQATAIADALWLES
jgi:hypothetical protein